MKKFFENVGADFSASVVVLLVAIPLCLGIALASGAPLFSGIIAGIIGGIVVGALSGSHISVSGPAAGLTVIVLTAISQLKQFDIFFLAVVLAGVIQIVLGFVKAGVIGDYVPNSVIKGMLAAIGLILILKQIPHLVGFDSDFEGDQSFSQNDNENTFTAIFDAYNYITPLAAIIGVLSIFILVFWEWRFIKNISFLKMVPAPLIVVVVGVLLNIYCQTIYPSWVLEQKHLVNLPVSGSAAEFFSFFTFPDFSAIANPLVWKAAVTIAVVASLETLLGIEASDKIDPFRRVTPANRELKAQGVGNMLSGLIGGIPITSVIVRSSANALSGAKSKMSSILHGCLMLLFVMLTPGLLNLIPLSALAAVLIFTGYKLAKVTLFISFYKKGWDQFVPFVVTIVAILFTDLLSGIVVGIMVGLFFMIRSNFRSSVFVVSDQNNYLVRLRKDVSFLNKPIIKYKLEEVPANSFVLIDATRADFIDKDIIEEINNFCKHAHLKNIRVEIKRSEFNPMHLLFHEPVLI